MHTKHKKASAVPTLAQMRPIILRIARAHGATNVRVFGSFARGEQKKSSDVDLLVRFRRDTSLLDHSALVVALREALNRNVDVLNDSGINPYIRHHILQEATPL